MHARNVGKSAVALLLSKASFPAREKLSSRTELGGSAFCDSCFLAHHVRVSSGEKSECSGVGRPSFTVLISATKSICAGESPLSVKSREPSVAVLP